MCASSESPMTSGHTQAASVALDIGAGRGALILYPSDRFRDREIEISRHGEARRVHTGVHERSSGERSMLTAIFGSLPCGDYDVWDERGIAATVAVPGGTVAEL